MLLNNICLLYKTAFNKKKDYLAVSVVPESLMSFINHETLYLGSRTRSSRQVIHHDLRCKEEDPLAAPDLLPVDSLS